MLQQSCRRANALLLAVPAAMTIGMMSAPSAHAVPANCNAVTNPQVVYTPCWQSYVHGEQWAFDAIKQLGRPPRTIPGFGTDQVVVICRQGLSQENPPDRAAWADGCSSVFAAQLG